MLLFAMVFSHKAESQQPVFLQRPTPWADSLLQSMTLDQKIGQLFMLAAWSDPGHKDYNASTIQSMIDQYGIGGIIFMQGSPGRQAALTNKFQKRSQIPLLIAMDAEWGLGMRLDSTISFPRQLTLGATTNDSLIYAFGAEAARQLKRLGVHVSFSPVVDINNNPFNPVISNRSFGENKYLVTQQSLMYMQGLQDNGILACAKHFPGHGDTDVDSHKGLPIVNHSINRLDTLELYPYRELISKGLGSVMTAHLHVPAYDSTLNVASTLSRIIIHNLLRERMQFEGLVFTDALNMQGVAKYYEPGEVDLQALKAGNDVLLFSQNIPLAIEKIKASISNGEISLRELDEHCLRILRAKEWTGLNKMQPVQVANIAADLNTVKAEALRRELIVQSITVLKNDNGVLPLAGISNKKIAVVNIGVEGETTFERAIAHYSTFDKFYMEKSPDFKRAMWLRDTLSKYDLVIAGMLNTSNKPSKNFGITNESARILNSVGEKAEVVLCIFANPYAVNLLKELNNIESILVCYQDDATTHEAAAEIIVGAYAANGALPITANKAFAQGAGLTTKGGKKLMWKDPQYFNNVAAKSSGTGNISNQDSVGTPAGDYEEDMMVDGHSSHIKLHTNSFSNIDAIAQSGITKGAYPGCRVLAAKDGIVVYDKAFGNTSWKSAEKVNLNTVYDLASITKVASSTLAAMKLSEEGKLDVDKTLGDYLDIPQDNPYHSVVIKNMLSHCAGFTAWIPFHLRTIENGQLSKKIYSAVKDNVYSEQVADGIFIRPEYRDSIFNQILSTPISKDKSYKYSDLGYYFIQRIVEKQSGMTLDQFVKTGFYDPMGLSTIGYNPLNRMNVRSIAPTEDDKVFRHQHLQGYVHDQGAALMGGVAGHAGLFSNAQDLAAIMQMLMDGGSYGGRQYLQKATIDQFNTRYFTGNRRGLGFDKPSLSPGHGSTCKEASAQSFGHTGFTGTMCWADPQTGIVFVFLSNRVNPDPENKKLQDLNIRTEIQEEIYRVFRTSK